MQNQFIKIDSSGNYCNFPGVTVVSAVRDEDLGLWKQVFSELNNCELTKKLYAFLPVESYHMTATDLYTESVDGGTSWNKFVENNLSKFQKIGDIYNEKAFKPEIIVDSLLVVPSVILLIVKLNQEQYSIIESIAGEFDMKGKIPWEFHITLGYSYKTVDDATLKLVISELETNLTCLGKKFELQPPKLCYFKDMLAFIPWDAKISPFN